jgi:ribosomal RNA-processing protein 1
MRALVKKLGHVAKESRDKAVQKLKIFLASRRGPSTTELDFLKLWKGLFYCMWMSDKTPIQQELATELAQLVHIFADATLVALWLRTFHLTMRREWHMIDKYRLDKYYSLMRYVEHEAVVYLRKTNYQEDNVLAISDHIALHFTGHEASKRQGTGVVLHFVEVFLSEVYKAVGSSVTTTQFEQLFLPILHGYSQTASMERALARRTETAVFDAFGDEFWFRDCDGTKLNSESSEDLDADTDNVDDDNKMIFRKVKLAKIAAHVWHAASGPDCMQSRRKVLYAFHKRLKRLLKQHGTHYAITVAPLLNAEDTEEQQSKSWAMLVQEEQQKNTGGTSKKNKASHKQAKELFEREANQRKKVVSINGMDIDESDEEESNEEESSSLMPKLVIGAALVVLAGSYYFKYAKK